MSDPKTNDPVPLWYKVTVKFSDSPEEFVEHWNQKIFAERALEDWKRIEADDQADGAEYRIEYMRAVPMYTPMKTINPL